jgi:CheY-like chemotaxis protein
MEDNVPELKRILLVEDNAKDVELTLEALSEYKIANEVIVVRDGQQALDFMFRKGEYEARPPGYPAVILLDLKMPKVDGLEVLRRLKSSDEFKRIPIVMLTSSREEADLVKSYDLGVNSYVVKPVGFPEFLDAVKQLGVFWAMINEPPPGTSDSDQPKQQ